MKSFKQLTLLTTICVLLGSCRTEPDNLVEEEEGIRITNDLASLNARVVDRNQPVTITSYGSGRIDGDVSLTLLSDVAPPEIATEPVMATSVFQDGDHFVVSYNTAGSEYSGAVVLMELDDDELEITSQVTFASSDVSHAILHEDALYAAGATAASSSPAWVCKFDVSNDQIQDGTYTEMVIGGFVATSVSPSDNGIYVTSGSGLDARSGVYQLSTNDLSEISYTPLADARWCGFFGEELYVQNGIPGEVHLFRGGTIAESFEVADAALDAKASFDIVGEYLFVGAGQNGVQILDTEGVFDSSIPLPEANNPDFNTNSVAVYGDMVFISNGAGVYVATYSEDEDPQPEIVGQLELGDFESVNHITFVENKLIVASGLGGVKVIELDIELAAPISGEILSKDNMEVIYFDSEEPKRDRYASYLIDGNLNTFWHTEWVSADPVYPHEVQIDLGETYDLTEFRYQSRQWGNFNGTIKDFELYISSDTTDWGTPFFTGQFEKVRAEQVVTFPAATGRYLRFRALSEVNDNPWASGSELNFVGTRSSD